MDLISLPDTARLKEHPLIKSIRHQQQIAEASLQMEKSRLLPDLNVCL